MLRIVSWNVAGLRAWLGRLTAKRTHSSETDSDCTVMGDYFQNVLKADVVCLQEHKLSDVKQLTQAMLANSCTRNNENELNIEGYDAFFSFAQNAKGYSGVVTFVRRGLCFDASEGFSRPLSKTLNLPVIEDEAQDYDKEGRCVITWLGERVCLFNVYFPNGGRGQERQAFKMTFYDLILKRWKMLIDANVHVIVVGDVNTAHLEWDVHDPKRLSTKSGFLPEERSWLDRLFNEHGFVDPYRHLYPDIKGAYTFWDNLTRARERNAGWRIDYTLISSSLLSALVQSEILADLYGSDHCPIRLVLDMDKIAPGLLAYNASTPSLAASLPKSNSVVKQKTISSFFAAKRVKSIQEKENEKV